MRIKITDFACGAYLPSVFEGYILSNTRIKKYVHINLCGTKTLEEIGDSPFDTQVLLDKVIEIADSSTVIPVKIRANIYPSSFTIVEENEL